METQKGGAVQGFRPEAPRSWRGLMREPDACFGISPEDLCKLSRVHV